MTRRKVYVPITWAKRVPDMLRADGQPDTTAHAVLAALATYADKDTGRNARPSAGALAADTRFRSDVVLAALERCQKANLISKAGELTGGIIVWQLHLDVVADGPSVHDRREDRKRAVAAERQRRSRRHKAGEHSLCLTDCHATEQRDVTPRGGVTVTPPDSVTVTPPDTVTSRHEGRDVTPPDGVSHATSSVISAGHPGYTPIDPQLHPQEEIVTAAPPPPKKSQKGEPHRDDVEQLCALLLARIEANGVTSAAVTDAWRREARLMLDRDGRELSKVAALIEWATQDEFWRANILSMGKFRKQYETLRLQATREWKQRATPISRAEGWQAMKHTPASMQDSRAAGWQAMKSTAAPLAATGTDGLPLIYAVPETRALPRGGS